VGYHPAAERVEAHRVIAAGQDHPWHTSMSGAFEHAVGAVNVGMENFRPPGFLTDRGQVDHRVGPRQASPIAAGSVISAWMISTASPGAAAGGGYEVQQPEDTFGPGQAWSQEAADLPGGAGDEQALTHRSQPSGAGWRAFPPRNARSARRDRVGQG
jgi:hypothetical protein